MSDLHLWMQARSDQGESGYLSRVESVDKFDNNEIAFDCSGEEFGSIEASLYQVLHRTTSNEPLRIVQQTRGQKGCEAWDAIVRRYDWRNMSDKKISVCSTNQQHLREGQDEEEKNARSQETDARKLAEQQVQRDDGVVQ